MNTVIKFAFKTRFNLFCGQKVHLGGISGFWFLLVLIINFKKSFKETFFLSVGVLCLVCGVLFTCFITQVF